MSIQHDFTKVTDVKDRLAGGMLVTTSNRLRQVLMCEPFFERAISFSSIVVVVFGMQLPNVNS